MITNFALQRLGPIKSNFKLICLLAMETAGSKCPSEGERYESQRVPIDLLTQPIHFPIAKNVVAKNKFLKAPMTEMLCSYDANDPSKSGIPTPSLINLYRKWNAGGSAVIVTGCIVVSSEQIEGVGNAIIAKEVDTKERRSQFKKLAATATDGAIIIAQILHPGRRAFATGKGHQAIDMNTATKQQLQEIVEQHVYAAQFAKDCGFHGVEVNVSLDFALGQLVTASANERKDEYGGTLQNRTNILFEIISGIRERVKDEENFIIGMKMSAPNYEPNFDENEFAEYCRRIEASKLDYVCLAGGHYYNRHRIDSIAKESSRKREAFFIKFVNVARKHIKKVRAFMCGGFYTAQQAWEAVSEGLADGVGMAKALAAEPDLPRRILAEEILAGKKSLIVESDYRISKNAAGTQIWQLANDKGVLDLTNQSQVNAFLKALAEHDARPKTLSADLSCFGYPKLEVS